MLKFFFVTSNFWGFTYLATTYYKMLLIFIPYKYTVLKINNLDYIERYDKITKLENERS